MLLTRPLRWLRRSKQPTVCPQAHATADVRDLMTQVRLLSAWSASSDVRNALPEYRLPVLDLEWSSFARTAGVADPEQIPSVDDDPPPIGIVPDRKVVILVLTWNGLDYTRRCLDTLRAVTDHPNFEILVVDNGSTDGTLDYLATRSDIRILENGKNLGFVRGNNRGLEFIDAGADVVLLNNDVEIDQRDWLLRMQAAAHADPEIGVVGCRLRYAGGLLQHAGVYLPLSCLWGQQIGGCERDIGQHPERTEVESVVFACVLLKRETLTAIGGLDERYFSYFEDTDYCLTARERGLKTICCGDVTVLHHQNVSTEVNRTPLGPMFQKSQATFREKWESRLTRPRPHLDWRSIVNLPTGYGLSSRQMILALDRIGVEVSYKYLYGPGTTFVAVEPPIVDHVLLDEIAKRPFRTGGPQVVYGQGDAFAANDGAYKIGFTMLETTGFPAEWVRQANLMDEVWVPSTFNERTMRESGVTRPIRVVPLGVDPAYFHPRIERCPNPHAFTFLSVFEWGERKAPDLLLRAFTDEFGAQEDAILTLKIINRDDSVDVRNEIQKLRLRSGGGRVVLSMNDVIPAYQLGSLYRSADCFVLPTRGEGWGMPALEAMACGVPVIATNWSAITDFLTPKTGYLLDVEKLIPAQAKCPYYKGFSWAQPSYEHLRSLMRHVYENRNEAKAIGEAAAIDVRENWTWERTAKKIRKALDDSAFGDHQ